MKRKLSELVNKITNIYAGMSLSASYNLIIGQTKAPASLVKKI